MKKIELSDFWEFSWSVWFLLVFMYLGSWKSSKIRQFNFLQFSWPRVHENPQKSDDSIFMTPDTWKSSKIRQFNFLQLSWPSTWKSTKIIIKIKASDFLWKLNRLIFVDFHVPPGSCKLRKIKASDFCEISCTRGHENWRKLNCLIFEDFHVPGVIRIEENWIVWFLRIFMYPGTWKSTKIIHFNFLENWIKSKRLIFFENWIFWFL